MASDAPGQDLDSATRGPIVITLYWLTSVLSGIIIILRIWARSLRHNLGLDDWLMLVSWVGAVTFPR